MIRKWPSVEFSPLVPSWNSGHLLCAWGVKHGRCGIQFTGKFTDLKWLRQHRPRILNGLKNLHERFEKKKQGPIYGFSINVLSISQFCHFHCQLLRSSLYARRALKSIVFREKPMPIKKVEYIEFCIFYRIDEALAWTSSCCCKTNARAIQCKRKK